MSLDLQLKGSTKACVRKPKELLKNGNIYGSELTLYSPSGSIHVTNGLFFPNGVCLTLIHFEDSLLQLSEELGILPVILRDLEIFPAILRLVVQ